MELDDVPQSINKNHIYFKLQKFTKRSPQLSTMVLHLKALRCTEGSIPSDAFYSIRVKFFSNLEVEL